MAFVLQLKREFLVLVLSKTFSVLFVHGWPVCPRELNSLGRKNLHDMRLPNHYWSQPITFNRHCVCMLFPTLWAFQGAEELFNSHLTDSKTWTESSLCVAFLAQPPTVPCATLQQPPGTMAGFCRSSGSSTLLEHPPGRTQQPCGGVNWEHPQVLSSGATQFLGLTRGRDQLQQTLFASCCIALSKAAAMSPLVGTAEWLTKNILIRSSFQSVTLNKLTPISAYCAINCSSSGAASWAMLSSPSQGQANDGVYPSSSHLLPPSHQSPQ